MTIEPAFVFLPGDDESANDLLARYAEERLTPGPMGWQERPEAMRDFLTTTFTNGAGLWHLNGTTCALFIGGCLIGSGVQDRRPSPRITGITTWIKASWFSGDEWIPVEKLEAGEESIIRGDIFYWCGTSRDEPKARWTQYTNGHVACARQGDGFVWSFAQGGGANGRCALHDPASDVLENWNRHLRGVWRPNLMAATVAGKSLVVPKSGHKL